MSSFSGIMRYRVTVVAGYDGYEEFNEAKLRIDEIMDEAQRKLVALGYETDVIIRDDDGSVPSPAEAALDEEERRRQRGKQVLETLRELNRESHAELLEKVRAAVAKIK